MNTAYYNEFEIYTSVFVDNISNFLINQVNITGDTEATRKEQIIYYGNILESLMYFKVEHFEECITNKFDEDTLLDMKQEVYETFDQDEIDNEWMCFQMDLYNEFKLTMSPYVGREMIKLYEDF